MEYGSKRKSRVLHGTRGLKPNPPGGEKHDAARRVLHGTRGLKRVASATTFDMSESRPSRDAWIETMWLSGKCCPLVVASITGRVD